MKLRKHRTVPMQRIEREIELLSACALEAKRDGQRHPSNAAWFDGLSAGYGYAASALAAVAGLASWVTLKTEGK